MGFSRSPDQLAAKLQRAANAVPEAAKVGVFQAALHVKTSVAEQLVIAGVQGGRLRGVGKKGAKIGVGFNVKGTRNPSALVKMRGPAHLLEADTRPHRIQPKKKKSRAINIPGIGPRSYANHPGTHGKHPWRIGVARALPKVPEIMVKAQRAELRKIFK